jgi:hypothetical protein
MIAIGLLFVRMLCDCFKSRRQLEAENLVLRHQLNVLRRHVDCICVGPTVLCSFGSIVAVLAYLTPLRSSGPRLLYVGIEWALPPTGDGNKVVPRKWRKKR